MSSPSPGEHSSAGTWDELIEDFSAMTPGDRLQAVIDAGVEAAPLPPEIADRRAQMEPVAECQAPVFLLVDIDERQKVRVYVDAPAHAPTTRGYAALVVELVTGLTAEQALLLPQDLPERLGLSEVVSPLRLRGMHGLGRRLRRQVSAHLGLQVSESGADDEGEPRGERTGEEPPVS